MGKNIDLVDVISERIQKSEFGTFIKEEEAYDLVKQAIEKAFFKPYTVREKQQYGNDKIVEYSSRLETVVREQFQSKIDELISKWLQEHDEEVITQLKSFVEDQMAKVTVEAVVNMMFKQMLEPTIEQLRFNMQNKMMNFFSGMGR